MEFRDDNRQDAPDRRVYRPSPLREVAFAWFSLVVFVFCVLVQAAVVLGRTLVKPVPEPDRSAALRPRARADLAPLVPAPYPTGLRREDPADR